MNLSQRFNELTNKGKDPKQGDKTTNKKKLNCNRKRKDKEGLGIKYTKLSLNILGANCRSINNKQASITEILDKRAVDIGVFSELNTKKPPKFTDL